MHGGPRSTWVTDQDPTDPAGRGRGNGVRSGITDRDSGASADPAGNGRGPQPGPGEPTAQERWQSCVRLSNRRDELRRELLQPQYWDRNTIASAIADADRIDQILYIDPDEGPMLGPVEYGQRVMNAYGVAARYGVNCHPTDRDCFAVTLRRMASTAGGSYGSAQHVQLQAELTRIEEVMGRNCPNGP